MKDRYLEPKSGQKKIEMQLRRSLQGQGDRLEDFYVLCSLISLARTQS